MSSKRTDSRTVAAEVERFAARETPILPTRPLNDTATEHFERIIETRERSTWKHNDLALATNMAWALAQLDKLAADIEVDGHTLTTPKGGFQLNPDVSAFNQLSSSIRAFGDKLGLSAAARGIGNNARQQARNELDQQTGEQVGAAAAGDDGTV